jgi:hypothetical protein
MLEGLKPQDSPGTLRHCKIVRIGEKLDDSDRTIYLDAVSDDEKWPALALERALRTRGISVSNDTILAHRRGVCCCGATRSEQ